MRLLICAGGTGGGVYPALAVLQALADQAVEVLWVGSESGMEAELIHRQNIPFKSIPAGGIHGVGVKNLPGNVTQLLRGIRASNRILSEFRPNVLFFTGGFIAAPMAFAGRTYPSLLFVPDVEPGLAIKFISRFAEFIALTTESSRNYFNDQAKLIITGYPTRPELNKWNKKKGRATLKLEPRRKTLLVLGGSKGARSINRALFPILSALLEKLQIVHISGNLDWPETKNVMKNLPAKLQHRYHAFSYLHEEIGAALASADLVISRAGASTLGEYPLFGLPAVLVPYPHAWRYQRVNADFLEANGGAIQVKDEELEQELLPAIRGIMDSPIRLENMSASMRKLANPIAAGNIAQLLIKLSQSQGATS
jgi:undecaprenyldiphospho-muramoylpentapeptide beta-N-acetylglucosaminyltransferase